MKQHGTRREVLIDHWQKISTAKGIAMLVLTRQVGEQILIGEDIKVTVTRIGPDNVRIGIDAPKQVNIVRSELINREPHCPRCQAATKSNSSITTVFCVECGIEFCPATGQVV